MTGNNNSNKDEHRQVDPDIANYLASVEDKLWSRIDAEHSLPSRLERITKPVKARQSIRNRREKRAAHQVTVEMEKERVERRIKAHSSPAAQVLYKGFADNLAKGSSQISTDIRELQIMSGKEAWIYMSEKPRDLLMRVAWDVIGRVPECLATERDIIVRQFSKDFDKDFDQKNAYCQAVHQLFGTSSEREEQYGTREEFLKAAWDRGEPTTIYMHPSGQNHNQIGALDIEVDSVLGYTITEAYGSYYQPPTTHHLGPIAIWGYK